MSLKITTQTNEQECGVCAITSLHNFYYSDKLEKEQVLDKSNIGSTGMTIFDFEVLASKTGLECESYEVDWSEFINIHINNYFVALVSTKDGQANHYVIVKKMKKHFQIYDSCSLEVKELSLNEFKNIFLNVVILVNKKPNKLFSKIFSNTKTLLLFDLKFVLLNLLLSTLVLTTSILGASFLNWIIDASISKGSINNLISISFIFIFVYVSNNLITYISNLYVSNKLKEYYMLFTSKILSSIQNKKKDFLNKVDKNWIFKVDECVYSISNFCVLEVNKFITNIIFSFICICIVGSMNVWMLIFVIVFALIEFIPFLFSHKKKKELFIKVVRTENQNAQQYKNIIFNLSFETWQQKRKTIIENIKNNYSKIYKNFNDVNIFRSNNELIKSLIKSISEVALIATASYLIIKQKGLSIGKLTFIIAAFSLFKTSVNDIFNYFLSKIEFDVYWQVYKDLTDVSNLNETQLECRNIKTLSFSTNNKVYQIDTAKKLNIIDTTINEVVCKSDAIKIDNKLIDKDSKNFYEHLIVVDQHSSINIDLFMEMLNRNPNLYASYIQHFDLDINQQPISFYNKIIINFLCLLSQKDEIVIIDNLLNYIHKKDKPIIKDILNRVRLNNSLFIVGKEDYD